MKYSALLFLLLPCFSLAGVKGDAVEKKINKSFSIPADGQLRIENKYGDVDIAIGEGRTIQFDITITVTAGSEKKAQEQLDNINVRFEESPNRVEAVTDIESSSSWLSWFNMDDKEIEINYSVLVPKDIYLNLENRFGSLYVESTDRDANITVAYGDLRLGDINANLHLDMSYSEGSMSQIKNGNLKLMHSDLDMENSQALNIDMQYAELNMGSANKLQLVSSFGDIKGMDVDEVQYSGKYDDVYFDRVKTIHAESGYSGLQLDGLMYAGDFDMNYGDLTVSNIASGFKRIDIRSSFVGVNLEFASNASYTLDAQTRFCEISYDEDDLKVTERIERETELSVKGAKGSGGGQVVAVMTHGELSLE